MLTSRSIPAELWMQARARLIFYFSRRLGSQNAEDLAQTTLLTIYMREDYEFAKEEDFLRVCYGFAKRILLEAQRENAKSCENVELSPGLEKEIFPIHGLKGLEASTFLGEVKQRGQQVLDREEWALIEASANRDDGLPSTGRTRIKLYRIRKKLAKITGW